MGNGRSNDIEDPSTSKPEHGLMTTGKTTYNKWVKKSQLIRKVGQSSNATCLPHNAHDVDLQKKKKGTEASEA